MPAQLHCDLPQSHYLCVMLKHNTEHQWISSDWTIVNNLIAVTIRPGTLVTLPVPSGSYCVLELPSNTNLMYSNVRYVNELDIVDPVVITTTDNNSGVSIMTTDDGIITPSFAAVGKSIA